MKPLIGNAVVGQSGGPTVAINASWMTTNPSMIDGFHNRFSGFFNAGVMVKIPVFHGFEALNKTRKAKAEAALYRSKYEDTKNLINLELTQLYSRRREALDRLVMSQSDLECAEENLRMAMLAFEEVRPTKVETLTNGALRLDFGGIMRYYRFPTKGLRSAAGELPAKELVQRVKFSLGEGGGSVTEKDGELTGRVVYENRSDIVIAEDAVTEQSFKVTEAPGGTSDMTKYISHSYTVLLNLTEEEEWS